MDGRTGRDRIGSDRYCVLEAGMQRGGCRPDCLALKFELRTLVPALVRVTYKL